MHLTESAVLSCGLRMVCRCRRGLGCRRYSWDRSHPSLVTYRSCQYVGQVTKKGVKTGFDKQVCVKRKKRVKPVTREKKEAKRS